MTSKNNELMLTPKIDTQMTFFALSVLSFEIRNDLQLYSQFQKAKTTKSANKTNQRKQTQKSKQSKQKTNNIYIYSYTNDIYPNF